MAFIATFHYDDLDPYAVGITFHIPDGEVPWVVARSLLRCGLTEPAGDGDIRLWPALDENGCAIVWMTFHSPEGRLRVAVRSGELLSFLTRTWELVPVGAEPHQFDLDELVAALLA
ncbi:MAG: SsgA family sporulation/cell division regulator [Flavobacterium sp.]|nr:SsgA family sporulation/cell division regulator [Aeromicrobium sp.]